MAASTPQGKARFTPSRLAAMTVSQPRSSSYQRSFFASVISREFAPGHISPAALLSELSCDTAADQHDFRDEDGHGVPPFCPRYCPWVGSNHLLGVADEEGWLSLIDTAKPARDQPPGSRPGSWRAHHNAIFDFCFSPEEGKLVTASGDQTIRLWDISIAGAGSSAAGQRRAGTELLTCRGHTGSVKSVCARPNDRFVFASASRDGNVHIYDSRQGGSPAMTLRGVHAPSCAPAKRKRVGSLRGTGTHGVTAVLYLMDERNVLATAGGTDGAVKLWDSRLGGATRGRSSSSRPTGGLPGPTAPLCTLLPDRGSDRHHGITCLAIDGEGGRLLASSTDNAVYCYDTVRPESGEVARFSGHHVGSFYIKARFSHDGRFILSGSSDGHVYIWEVDRPATPPLYLDGHGAEVTGVDWHPTDLCQMASCSDDGTVRVWKVDRGTCRRALGGGALLPSSSPAAASPAAPPVVHSPWPARRSPSGIPAHAVVTPAGPATAARSILAHLLGVPGPAAASTPQAAQLPAAGPDTSMDTSRAGMDVSMDTSGGGASGGRPSEVDRPTALGRASPGPGTSQASLRDYFCPAPAPARL